MSIDHCTIIIAIIIAIFWFYLESWWYYRREYKRLHKKFVENPQKELENRNDLY